MPTNIVIIYADDLGYGDLGCFGAADLSTPHIDALAASGTKWTNWYSNSPVCSPSRASLLTGLYPADAGVEDILPGRRDTDGLPPQRTLPNRLQSAGYRTGIFGKWHLGMTPRSSPTAHGFDEFFGFRAGCVDYYSHIMYWGKHRPLHDLWENQSEIWCNGEYLTDAITDRAVDFIERSAAQPFLCYVPYSAPHYPMHAPKKWVDAFAGLPAERRILAAMIAAMDAGVGRIVDALTRLGLRDDTIVVFSSDNGPSAEESNWLGGEEIAYAGGSTGGLRGHKGSLFEGGIRVPMLLSWPAVITPGRIVNTPGIMIDLAPTLLAAATPGATPQGPLAGINLLPSLSGEQQAPVDRTLYWAYGTQMAARRGDWKLVWKPIERLGGQVVTDWQISHLGKDPAEQCNMAEAEPAIVNALSADLMAWALRRPDVSGNPGGLD